MSNRTEHPDYTADYVYFTVVEDGRHLFTTDQNKMGFDVVGVREVLQQKFPASEGYKIIRNVRPNSSMSEQILN